MKSFFSGFQLLGRHRRFWLCRCREVLLAALLFLPGFVFGMATTAQGDETPTPVADAAKGGDGAKSASPAPSRPRAAVKVVRGGWYLWDPYQYPQNIHGVEVLTGFDVEIERAIARVLGVELMLPEVAWDAHLAELAAGTRDIAAGATYSKERDQYAYFSKPYRRETDVLIVLKGASSKYPCDTDDQMLELFRKQHFRLGVVAGFTYADARVNQYVADPANAALIVKEGNDLANLENLLYDRVDGFLADRIVAATIAWRQEKSGLIEEHPVRFSTDIHFMLSRVSTTPAALAHLNDAIDHIKVRRRVSTDRRYLRLADLDSSNFGYRLVSVSGYDRHHCFCVVGRGTGLRWAFHPVRSHGPRQFACSRRRRDPRSAIPTRTARDCAGSICPLNHFRHGHYRDAGDQDQLVRWG